MLNQAAIVNQTQRLAGSAVTTGVVREADGIYRLDYNPETNNYDATSPTGERVASFRTYKITQAKKWLREYLHD